MSIVLSIPLFFMVLISSFADVRPLGETLDVSSIRTIVIIGDASSIKITTKSDEPDRAATSGRLSGWFSSWYSSWFFILCKDESRSEIDGATLTIDVAMSAWSDIADCSPEISANVPLGSAVRIEQEVFVAKLNGDFASLGTSGKAADITLDGHASSVDISGAAVRANLTCDAETRRKDRDRRAVARWLSPIGQGCPSRLHRDRQGVLH